MTMLDQPVLDDIKARTIRLKVCWVAMCWGLEPNDDYDDVLGSTIMDRLDAGAGG